MGGGGSTAWWNPYNGCPENRYIVSTDPKPNDGDITAGVKVSTSKACSTCEMSVDGNLSSATAELRSAAWAGATGNADTYSMETKAWLLPSLPFSVTFNGVAESYPVIEIYRPSPIRIENIQHDAVIQIGNFFFNKVIILIPIISANMIQGGSTFVGAFASQIPTVLEPPKDASGNPLPMVYPNIPTGSDWTLDKILDASSPYFTWTSSQYQQGVVSANRCGMRMGWHPVPPGQRVIMMQNPISIAPAYMAQIKRLPHTNPSFAIHGIGPVAYKGAPPKDCAPPKMSLPAIPKVQDPIAQLASNAKNENNTLELVFKIILGIIGSLAVVIGIYFGLKFGMGPGGKILAKLGESLGQKMAQAGAAARAGIANTAGVGKTGVFPAKRTPIDDTPLPEPTEEIVMTNNPMWTDRVPAEKKNLTRRNASRDSGSPLPEGNEPVTPDIAPPLPDPNETITVPRLPPHLRPRTGRNTTVRRPLRQVPPLEGNSPLPEPNEAITVPSLVPPHLRSRIGRNTTARTPPSEGDSPLPEPTESITVPTLPPHLRPRTGRNTTVRRPLRQLPPFEGNSPLPEPNEAVTVPSLVPPHLRSRIGRNGTTTPSPQRPTPEEVSPLPTEQEARDFASLDQPFVAPPTLSAEEEKEMDDLDGRRRTPTVPPPPPPGTHGLWRNGVSLRNTNADNGPLPAANEPIIPTRRAMTVNADARAQRNALLAEDTKDDDSPLPTPSESNRSLASVASVASRLSRRASQAREAAADFDLAVDRTPTRPKTPEPTLAPPLPEGNELDNLTTSTGLDRSLARARSVNPDTGFTNSTGAKIRTADAFTNSLQRMRAARGEDDRSMTAQELSSIGAPKRTRAEKLALRKEGKKAGRRKTGRRNI